MGPDSNLFHNVAREKIREVIHSYKDIDYTCKNTSFRIPASDSEHNNHSIEIKKTDLSYNSNFNNTLKGR